MARKKKEQPQYSFAEFVNEIATYESDTFSAIGAGITIQEANTVAENLLEIWRLQRLDGVIIDAVLADLRGIN